MARALIFPGQGSQTVGMGRELAAAMAPARYVCEEVDEALQLHLSRLMFDGPEADLMLTANAQPALLAASIAVLRTLEQEGGLEVAKTCCFVAGHSLGEYSALCAAGAIALEDAVRLVRRRGQAMQEAVPEGVGAMAALLGLDLETVQEVAAEATDGEVCDAANDNAPGQVVVSGHAGAVERAVEIAKGRGARRAVMLPVSAPFHCRLMQPVSDVMAEALEAAPMSAPVVPVVANVTADAVSDPEEISKLLVEQVTALVRWREGVLYMIEQEVDTLVELGAGKVLSGLARRIDRDVQAISVTTPLDVEEFLKTL